jgi:hypothetical protein
MRWGPGFARTRHQPRPDSLLGVRSRGAVLVRHVAISAGVVVAAAGIGSSAASATAALLSGVRATSETIVISQKTSTTSVGGLTITLAVSPAQAAPGVAVGFTVSVSAQSAIGSLGYRLHFADGTSRANAVPQFCRAGPAHQSMKAGALPIGMRGRVARPGPGRHAPARPAPAAGTVVTTAS